MRFVSSDKLEALRGHLNGAMLRAQDIQGVPDTYLGDNCHFQANRRLRDFLREPGLGVGVGVAVAGGRG